MTRRARRAISVVGGGLTWPLVFYASAVSWSDFVAATGDTTSECDRGQCGTLGEFTANHSFILFLLFLLGTALVALAFAWMINRALRRFAS